jgi:hypothetical protein
LPTPVLHRVRRPQAPPLLRKWTVVRASHPWPTTARVEEGWRGRQRRARRPISDAMAGLAWRRTGRPATALVEKGGDLRVQEAEVMGDARMAPEAVGER